MVSQTKTWVGAGITRNTIEDQRMFSLSEWVPAPVTSSSGPLPPTTGTPLDHLDLEMFLRKGLIKGTAVCSLQSVKLAVTFGCFSQDDGAPLFSVILPVLLST